MRCRQAWDGFAVRIAPPSHRRLSMPTALSFSEIAASASHAVALIARHPLRWLLLTLVYLVAVEALMFIPYIGFLVKLAVAGIVGAQVLALCLASDAGDVPRLRALPRAFLLPVSSQIVLSLSALIPFGVGMLYLLQQGGVDAIRFFFGNVLTEHPPNTELF